MHFCPRDTCQTAWHRQCLLAHPIKKRPTYTDRKLSLMCSVPSDLLNPPASSSTSTSISTPSSSLLSLLSKPKSALHKSKSETRKRKRDSEVDALSLLEGLPQDLVKLASQPIIKPTLESFEKPSNGRKGRQKVRQKPGNVVNNVAGNVTMVLKARVLVNDVLRVIAILPQDWRKKIGCHDSTMPSAIVDDGENRSCPPLLCPRCGEHI